MLKRILTPALVLSAAIALFSAPAAGSGPDKIVIDDFSAEAGPDGLPPGWRALDFPRVSVHTKYEVEADGEERYLKAVSASSASALYKDLDLDPREYRYLSWRWRVERTIELGDETKKAGDDYAARVYVIFEYDPERASLMERLKYKLAETIYRKTPPGNSLVYIWANRLEKNASAPNPYTDKAMMIAVESGGERVGEWITEERDIYEDHRRVFLAEPTRIKGVAVMTDTDNTRENALAYYDDIVFLKKATAPPPEPEETD